MQKYTFHNEIKDLLTQFLQAFDGAVVKRFSGNTPGATVAVRYVYAPKQRVLHDLVNKAQHITLPAVSFWINSISRDPNRVFNKLEGIYSPTNSTAADHTLQPVPINIEISISILARFQTDMDQILSSFVPYNDPYFVISWTRQGMPDKEIRTEVLWGGSLSLGYPMDLTSNQPARVTCDTSFTIKGWLFKHDADPVGKIYKINNNFYNVDEVPVNGGAIAAIQAALSGTDYIETVSVSARPQPALVTYSPSNSGIINSVSVYGDMLQYTNNVYVSGASGMFTNTTTVSTFASASSLSADYPTLYNLKEVSSFVIESNNKLTITYPTPAIYGSIKIFIFNEAGYGSIEF